MIQYYSNEKQNKRTLKKVSKKLKIDPANISFAAYDKFLFSYLFALAIQENKIYLFASDENAKKENVYSTYSIDQIKGITIDNRTDVNLHLSNHTFINLTSIVGITKKNQSLIKMMNDQINKA